MNNKVTKATITLMIATMLAKILGFVREQVLSYAYGISMYTDVYVTAMSIPTVIFAGIGVAISTTFIPIFCDIENRCGERESAKFTNNVLMIVIVVCTILAILGIVFAEQVVKIFAIGFTGEKLSLAISFTRIIIISIVSIGISNILTAYLQVKNNFFIPGLSTIPQNIIIIASILLSIKYGIYVLPWGALLGIISSLIFQIPFVYKEGFKFNPYLNIKEEYVKRIIILVGPVFLGVAVNQINSIVDKTLATTLNQGLLTSLSYANRLNDFVLAMFIASIATVIYPMLSKLSINNNKEEFKKSVSKSMNIVIILMIPITVGAIVLSSPIVKLLFERGSFNADATKVTSIALSMYAIGMVAFGLRNILDKVFYSLQDTKTPMKNGIISVCLNIVLNIILIKFMGHAGLALATSLSSIICVVLFCYSLKKKIGDFGQISIIKTIMKSIIASIVMGIITSISYTKISGIIGSSTIEQAISLFIPVCIGVVVYGLMIILLKIDEVTIIIDNIKEKLGRGKQI